MALNRRWLPMRNRLRQMLAALLCLAGCVPATGPGGTVRWAAYYHNKLPASQFAGLDLVVFDRRYHPDFKSLHGIEIYAYVSIGEVPGDAPEAAMLEKKGLLLGHQAKWGSHIVNITAPVWRKIVLDQVADADKQGFSGVMLDTLDSPLYWAKTQAPEEVEAFHAAAIELIAAIRRQHPRLKIILNRGFDILPDVAAQLDFVLAESILTQPDESSGQFVLAPAISYHQAVTQLHHVVAFAPRLQILTLDYWNQDDVQGVQFLYSRQRANGFSPYVSTPDLHHFTPEPAPAGRGIDRN